MEHCVRYGFDNVYGLEVISYDLVYGFQILSHLILFFADGFPQFFCYYWDGFPQFFCYYWDGFPQFFGYYWDGYPPIFRLLLRWISTNFYASTEMDFHQFFMLLLWSRVRFISKCFGPYLWLSWKYGFKSKKLGTHYYYRKIWIDILQFWHFSICN